MLLQAAHRWKNILVTHVCFCLCLKSASRQEVNQQIRDLGGVRLWRSIISVSVWNVMGKHSLNKALRSTDTGVRGVTHPSFVVAVVLEKAAEITTKKMFREITENTN